MSGSKKINYVYEFSTPAGYLPIGNELKNLPVIFDYINELNTEQLSQVRRVGYSGSKFRILNEVASCYDILNLDRFGIPQKLVNELTNDDILYKINLFVIDCNQTELIPNYVNKTDLTSILTEKTKKLFKNNKNFKLVFFDSKEGVYSHDNSFFNKLYELYNHLKLDNPYQIYYFTNTVDVENHYLNYLNKFNIKSFMVNKCINFYIYDDAGNNIITHLIQSNNCENEVLDRGVYYSIPSESEIYKNRNKHYMCLNRNSSRLHRPELILNFIKNNVFDKGIISLLQSDEFDRFACQPKNIEYKKLIFDKYPFTIDYEEPEFVADMHNFFTKKEHWLDTYFSVVTETSIEDDFCFISEKPIRPMIYLHPFIVLGNPNTLKRLKDLGFKTFPEFFDESYDQIFDKNLRKKIVMENVIKLCEKPIEEIHEMYINIIPKLIHNRNLLVKFAEEKKLYNEFTNFLTNNFKTLI
jgi:hypothetical protein